MHNEHIVIVGAGIVGLSTAYTLLKQGMKNVTVLEQAAVDHRRATSHGISRLLRFEYGSDVFYSKMVQLSLKRWKSLEQETQRTLCTQTELLILGNEGDDFTQPSYRTLSTLGLPTELLSRHICQNRFPQFNTHKHDTFTYNKEAGIMHASTCLHTLRDLIVDFGGVICEAQRVTRIVHSNKHSPIRLHFNQGDELIADRVVVAIGPWIHHLLGDLKLPVHMTQQYLLYFANLPTASYGWHTFPAFLSGDLYGFPIHSTYAGHGPSWLKATSHAFGTPVNPDAAPHVDEHIVTRIRTKLCELIPALKHAELTHIDTCIYDVSPDEDFILDYLPEDQRIVFATGLTGHGFKFGPLLGEILGSLIHNTQPPVTIERF